jgi:hypothetical protein
MEWQGCRRRTSDERGGWCRLSGDDVTASVVYRGAQEPKKTKWVPYTASWVRHNGLYPPGTHFLVSVAATRPIHPPLLLNGPSLDRSLSDHNFPVSLARPHTHTTHIPSPYRSLFEHRTTRLPPPSTHPSPSATKSSQAHLIYDNGNTYPTKGSKVDPLLRDHRLDRSRHGCVVRRSETDGWCSIAKQEEEVCGGNGINGPTTTLVVGGCGRCD